MQVQGEIEGSGFSPSFNCYSSDSITSKSIAKVIREHQVSQFHENEDVEDEDFEFKLTLDDDLASLKEINSRGHTVFPVFTREVDPETKSKHHETDMLEKVFNDQPEESSSSLCSSSEIDELEKLPSGTFCMWHPTNCKKSSSTGSGSKRWIIQYLLGRSNSEGKEPVLLFTHTKADGPKQKRSSGEVLKAVGRWKAGTSVHERFYVQRRAENEAGKRESYLPYRKDLVGFSFANVNGMGKMLLF